MGENPVVDGDLIKYEMEANPKGFQEILKLKDLELSKEEIKTINGFFESLEIFLFE